jgi:hypothetical protein
MTTRAPFGRKASGPRAGCRNGGNSPCEFFAVVGDDPQGFIAQTRWRRADCFVRGDT